MSAVAEDKQQESTLHRRESWSAITTNPQLTHGFPTAFPAKKDNMVTWGVLFHPVGLQWASFTLHPAPSPLRSQNFPTTPSSSTEDSGKWKISLYTVELPGPPNCCKAPVQTIQELSKSRNKSYLFPLFRRKWRISILQRNKCYILV